jgi:hypothetical protein
MMRKILVIFLLFVVFSAFSQNISEKKLSEAAKKNVE